MIHRLLGLRLSCTTCSINVPADNESKLSFSHVKKIVGDIPQQIPDESEPLKQELITLIDDGFPDKITGKKVSHLP